MLMDTWQGHRLNSPMTWWSNPTAPSGLLIRSSAFWGITKAIRPRLKWGSMSTVSTARREASVVADDVLGPNGLCFAPDESLLYVVESRGVPHRKILAYDVTANGRELRNKRVVIDAGPGVARWHAL